MYSRSCKFSKMKTVTEHVQYFKNRVCACSVAVFVSAEFARSQQTAVVTLHENSSGHRYHTKSTCTVAYAQHRMRLAEAV